MEEAVDPFRTVDRPDRVFRNAVLPDVALERPHRDVEQGGGVRWFEPKAFR